MTHETLREAAGVLSVTEAERLAEIMQALASPVRLRILSVLRARPSTVTELSEELGSGQTTVSNHLRLLRHPSLVVGSRDGRHVFCTKIDLRVPSWQLWPQFGVFVPISPPFRPAGR